MTSRLSLNVLASSVSVLALALLGGQALVAGPATAVGKAGGTTVGTGVVISTQVTICHATTSDSNPYIVNTPAADGNVSGHAAHTGPVWDATLKAAKVQWGDIIPAFYYLDGTVKYFPGLNNTAAGLAFLANNCATPSPTAGTVCDGVC